MTTSNDKPVKRLFILAAKYLLALFVILYLLIWIFSPLAVRHFAQPPLSELGLSLDADSSVRYNPFTSTITVSELVLRDKNKQQVLLVKAAEVSIHLHRLLFKQLYVSEFLLDTTQVEIVKEQQSLFIAGVDIFAVSETVEVPTEAEQPNETPSPSDFSVVVPELNIRTLNLNATVDGASQQVSLTDLSIEDVEVNQTEQWLELALAAKINDAPLTLESKIQLENGVGTIVSSFNLEQLDLQKLSPLLTEFGIQVAGQLSLKGNPKLQLSADKIQAMSQQISLSLTSLDLNYAPWLVQGEKDTIIIQDLAISALPNGTLKELTATVSTQLSVGNVGLDNPLNSVVNWQEINLSADIELNEMQPNVHIAEVIVDSLNLSEDLSLTEPSPILSIEQLGVTDLKFNDNLLDINSIAITGFKTDIKINADKDIISMLDTASLTPAKEPDEATEPATKTESVTPEQITEVEEDGKAVGIKLGEFLFADTGYIQINDQSVSPVFEQNIIIETLRAGPFDSTDLELDSPLKLVAKDENYLTINVDGHISPFADKLNAVIIAKINEVSLPSISPYLKDALGFEMKSGQLDLGVDVGVEQDEISGEAGLFLRGIEMSSAGEVEQGTIKDGKAMPLNAALGMLIDEQGNIDLDVPLRGNISDPSFGVESFIGLLIKKAAMSQAKSYLMTTFVPYASVISVAITGAEYLMKVTFEPLVFATAQTELTEENQQYLSELVLLMQDKPELQLKTCALVTYDDLTVAPGTTLNTEQLAQLKSIGSERQDNLKRYLIDQAIASSRILFCASELDTAEDAQPRIELKAD